jgi:hypothetical protein
VAGHPIFGIGVALSTSWPLGVDRPPPNGGICHPHGHGVASATPYGKLASHSKIFYYFLFLNFIIFIYNYFFNFKYYFIILNFFS